MEWLNKLKELNKEWKEVEKEESKISDQFLEYQQMISIPDDFYNFIECKLMEFFLREKVEEYNLKYKEKSLSILAKVTRLSCKLDEISKEINLILDEIFGTDFKWSSYNFVTELFDDFYCEEDMCFIIAEYEDWDHMADILLKCYEQKMQNVREGSKVSK